MKTTIIRLSLAVGILVVWGASLFLTYQDTREKWYDYGYSSGDVGSRSDILHDLCEFAKSGEAPNPAVWTLEAKANILELSGENGTFTLYCD